jgi:hypothetical protein
VTEKQLQAAERARSLWDESERLRVKAAQLRDEAAATDRASARLHRMAAAIADGRDDDLIAEANA